MKLRKALFVLIVAMLVFDIVLIARHKHLPLKPPLASGQSQDSAESKLPECDKGNCVFANVEPGLINQFIQFTLSSGYLRCPVTPVINFPLHCETSDGEKMNLVMVPDDTKVKPKPAPEPEMKWEPPAPKPAGERKL